MVKKIVCFIRHADVAGTKEWNVKQVDFYRASLLAHDWMLVNSFWVLIFTGCLKFNFSVKQLLQAWYVVMCSTSCAQFNA